MRVRTIFGLLVAILAFFGSEALFADTDGIVLLDFRDGLEDDPFAATTGGADGRIYVSVPAGANYYNGCGLFALDNAGTLVPDFGAGGRVANVACGSKLLVLPDRSLLQIAQANTEVYVFSPTGVRKSFQIAPVNANGVALQPDGKIILAGGRTDFVLARFNPDLTPDTTFSGGVAVVDGGSTRDDSIINIALAPDGKIVASAIVDARTVIARFNTNGSSDFSFGNNGQVQVPGMNRSILAVDSSGRIYFADGVSKQIRRLEISGTLDASYSSPVLNYSTLTSIRFDSQGRLLLFGSSGGSGPLTQESAYVARLTVSGALDASFGTAGSSTGEILLTAGAGLCFSTRASQGFVQADDKVLLVMCAHESEFGGQKDMAVARLDVNGALDAAFGANQPDSDLSPDAFTIPPTTAPYGAFGVVSNPVTPTGFNSATPLSVEGTGALLSVGCNEQYVSRGFLSPGQSFCVRQNAPDTPVTSAVATVYIGPRSATYVTTSTNEPADTTPDSFSFTNQQNIAINSTVTSNTILITGLTGTASLAVDQGLYSIGCTGQFTNRRGTITNGQSVCVQHTSSSAYQTVVSTTLAISGMTATFSTTTQAAPPPPGNGGGSGGGSEPPPSSGGGGTLDLATLLGLCVLVMASMGLQLERRSRRTAYSHPPEGA